MNKLIKALVKRKIISIEMSLIASTTSSIHMLSSMLQRSVDLHDATEVKPLLDDIIAASKIIGPALEALSDMISKDKIITKIVKDSQKEHIKTTEKIIKDINDIAEAL